MKLRIFTEPQQGASYEQLSQSHVAPRIAASTRSSVQTTICGWVRATRGRVPRTPGSPCRPGA